MNDIDYVIARMKDTARRGEAPETAKEIGYAVGISASDAVLLLQDLASDGRARLGEDRTPGGSRTWTVSN